MTEQQNYEVSFIKLFGTQGNYGSFCESGKIIENPQQASRQQGEQLLKEVGTGGISLFDRKNRIRITNLGLKREAGCSSIFGFFDNSQKADETLF